MKESMVYVVTSGEYSGYSIHKIFDNKESAKAYVELQNEINKELFYSRHYDIEEWELNCYTLEELREELKHFMEKRGK